MRVDKNPKEVQSYFKEIATNEEGEVLYSTETSYVENELDKELKLAHLTTVKQNNEARKTFAHWIFVVTVIWMFLILCLVHQTGRGNLRYSDTVLVALITTTTANVFGFLYLVFRYLFSVKQ